MREAANTGLFGGRSCTANLQTRIALKLSGHSLNLRSEKATTMDEKRNSPEKGREHCPLPSCQRTLRREKVTEPRHTRPSGRGEGKRPEKGLGNH